MRKRAFTSVAVCLCITASVCSQQPDAVRFETDIAPLLLRRCVGCHRGGDPSGGLSFTTKDGLEEGGHSGAVINVISPEQSYLLERVVNGEMPPEEKGESKQLPEHEQQILRRWISSGAPWPENRELDFFETTNDRRAGRDWWSLQPIVRPAIPQRTEDRATTSPIDALIRSKLWPVGLEPAARASPSVRLRRLYYVLTGLSPTRQEVEQFCASPTDEAWERAIDRLLDSPQYGVRWARHWLDLVRYADTCGYERDQEKPFAWKYRDWVVDAINHDLPYDQFITQQLAGDEMDNRTEASVIATGFLRLGPWNDEPNDPADYVYDRLEDLVHATSTAFLGMTVKCARCHSHKFDPITQEDYYRMASIFWVGPIDRGSDLGGSKPEELGVNDVLAWTDVPGKSAPIHLLKNGERHDPLQQVVPATLSFLPSLEHQLRPPAKGSKTSKRRLQFADWITRPENPLPARVMVNRIWQHLFGEAIVRSPNNFGFLADPPTHPELLDWLAAEFVDGGWRVKRLQKLILLSETWQQASTHEQSEEFVQLDSDNRYWWRANRRRLDAESLRDRLLEASGQLDLSLRGAGFRPTISDEALEGLSRKNAAWTASPVNEQLRRSLYSYVKRGLLPPMMTTFDFADTTLPCGQRDATTVPTQALTLLNNPFIHKQSELLAQKAVKRNENLDEQIKFLWSAVYKRLPSDAEVSLARSHLEEQREMLTSVTENALTDPTSHRVEALSSLAHVLLNSNEFLYVD